MDNRGKTLLTIDKTVEKLRTEHGMDTSTYAIRGGVQRKEVPHIKLGGKYFIIFEDLLKVFEMKSENSIKQSEPEQPEFGKLRKIY